MYINENTKPIILARFNLQIEDKLSVKDKNGWSQGVHYSEVPFIHRMLYSMSLCEAKSVFHHTALSCATLKNIPIYYYVQCSIQLSMIPMYVYAYSCVAL